MQVDVSEVTRVGVEMAGLKLYRLRLEISVCLCLVSLRRSMFVSEQIIAYLKEKTFCNRRSRRSKKTSKLDFGLFERYIPMTTSSREVDLIAVYSKLNRTGSMSKERGEKSRISLVKSETPPPLFTLLSDLK
ncbi:hypothetical protein M8J76_001347 [Diaphorina citri]|nr:hypothetical protein M8J76_001347 [Diaphorina citri]